MTAEQTSSSDPAGNETTSSPGATSAGDATGLGATSRTDSGATTTSAGDELEVLNHSGACDGAYTCSTPDGSIGSHRYAECFVDVAMDPPFLLTRVRYEVNGADVPQAGAELEVLTWTGTGPGSSLGSQQLTGDDIVAGPHELALGEPVTVNDDSFCVAIGSDEPLAMSLDTSHQAPERSYVVFGDCGWTECEPLTPPLSRERLHFGDHRQTVAIAASEFRCAAASSLPRCAALC